MSWADLFERAEAFAVEEATIRAALAERRSTQEEASTDDDGPTEAGDPGG